MLFLYKKWDCVSADKCSSVTHSPTHSSDVCGAPAVCLALHRPPALARISLPGSLVWLRVRPLLGEAVSSEEWATWGLVDSGLTSGV